MQFIAAGIDRVALRDEGRIIAEYVFRPSEPQIESPRPYLTLRTRAGIDVTAHRPADHVWHKGLSLALPAVGSHNFWGGPTYVHGEGYVQLANNGAQVHRGLRAEGHDDEPARITSSLTWRSQDDEPVLSERRRITADVVDEQTWALTWESDLRNETDAPLAFGSPTSKGRENAGYAGIFWRGPESFRGGVITAPDGRVGDEARGRVAPWLSYAAPDRSAGVLMLNADGAFDSEPWFARSEEYAGLNPAPFFHEETVLDRGASLTLAAVLLIGGPDVHELAATAGAERVARVRRSALVPSRTREKSPV
ncbi:PmoA family protein [Microbacterium gorillae]|uniref:DUF6807 domain-containing protein n=1 Tax=Microbacterium gorillae TaxID=1231063 RepID=UPI003D989D54